MSSVPVSPATPLADISESDYADVVDTLDSASILTAIDHVDKIRRVFDAGSPREPEFRTKLLRLHQIGMSFLNMGDRKKAQEFFDLNHELSDTLMDTQESMAALSRILDTIDAAYPESLTL